MPCEVVAQLLLRAIMLKTSLCLALRNVKLLMILCLPKWQINGGFSIAKVNCNTWRQCIHRSVASIMYALEWTTSVSPCVCRIYKYIIRFKGGYSSSNLSPILVSQCTFLVIISPDLRWLLQQHCCKQALATVLERRRQVATAPTTLEKKNQTSRPLVNTQRSYTIILGKYK